MRLFGKKSKKKAEVSDNNGLPFPESELKDCTRRFPLAVWNRVVTKKLRKAYVSGGVIYYEVEGGCAGWTGRLNHGLAIAVELDGEKCAAATEFGKNGNYNNEWSECVKPVRRNGKSMFKSPMKDMKVKGTKMSLMVWQVNGNGRTNWVEIQI